MLRFNTSGSTKNLEAFLQKMQHLNLRSELESVGREGVSALASATPNETGMAASSWGYIVEITRTGVGITWTNNDVEDGFPVVIALQYGYSTGTGGYVPGRDYINPAIRPIFDRLSDRVWRAVTNG